jgi:hypothetical protein
MMLKRDIIYFVYNTYELVILDYSTVTDPKGLYQ